MPARRRRGTGTYFQRKSDGLWVVRIPLGVGLSGKTEHLTEYHATEPAALAAHARLLADRDAGRLTTQPDLWTVADLLAYHLEAKQPPATRLQTFAGYERQTRLHILPTLGAVPLTELTTLRVETWLRGLGRVRHRRGVGLGQGTARNVRTLLSEALEHAVDLDLIPRNPAKRARFPSLSAPRDQVPYTVEETQAFLTAAVGSPLFAYWLGAAVLGLRRGELSGLTWPAVDLAARELRVISQVQRVNNQVVFLDYTKTQRSTRPLPLPAWLVEALTARWQQQQEERRAAGRHWGAGGWSERRLVFTTPEGRPFSPSQIDWRFGRICRAAELPRKGLHALRRTFATALQEEGTSSVVAQRLLGHTAERTTHRYQYSLTHLERAAVEGVERALKGTGKVSRSD